MPLPLNGLSIEELEHYSGIEPGATEELARRMADGRAAELRKIEQMEDELDHVGRQMSDLEDELNTSEDNLREMTSACRRAKEALDRALSLLPEQSEERELVAEITKTLEKLV